MSQEQGEDLFQTGPFSVTGEIYVIAANTGPTRGNTVARCFPICKGDKVIEAAEVATMLATLLNERMT